MKEIPRQYYLKLLMVAQELLHFASTLIKPSPKQIIFNSINVINHATHWAVIFVSNTLLQYYIACDRTQSLSLSGRLDMVNI